MRQTVRFALDHVLPQSTGGTDEADNLALACRNCNERHGNRLEGRDPGTQAVVPLFNPRRDLWAGHFAWDATRLRIAGCTPVEKLDLNDDRHDGNVIAFACALCPMDIIHHRTILHSLYNG